jgi:hexosaminidase
MSWRGIDGAIAAAKAGHDTVLCPRRICISIIGRHGDLARAAATLSLKDVYGFNPLPDQFRMSSASHPRSQANIWTNSCAKTRGIHGIPAPRRSPSRLVPASRISWADFQRRLECSLRYDKLGIGYAREVAVQPGARRRLSHDFDQCGDGYLLSLEDDAPVDGERAVFWSTFQSCWLWKGADPAR